MPFLTNKKLWSAALLSVTLVACGGGDSGGSTNTNNTNTTAQGLLSKALSTTDGLYDVYVNGSSDPSHLKISGNIDQLLSRDNSWLAKTVSIFNNQAISGADMGEVLFVKNNAEAKYTVQTDANGYANEMKKILQDTNTQLTITNAQINGVNFGESRITYVVESLANKSLMSALGTDNLDQLAGITLPSNFGNGAEGYKMTKEEVLEDYAQLVAMSSGATLAQVVSGWDSGCEKQPDIVLNQHTLKAYNCSGDAVDGTFTVATDIGGVVYTGSYIKKGFIDNTESWFLNKTAADTLKTAIEAFNGLSGLVK